MTRPDILCIGSVLWDIVGRAESSVAARGDIAGRIRRIPGGVALNIAMALRRLQMRPALISVVGADAEGQALAQAVQDMGLLTDWMLRSETLPTDYYMAIEDPSGLVAAIADAHSLEAAGDAILAPLLDGRLGSAENPWTGLVALDGNLTEALLSDISRNPAFVMSDLRVAPASPGKAERLLPLMHHPRATFYVNRQEAAILCNQPFADSRSAALGLIAAGARRALVTDGAHDATDASAGRAPITEPAHRVTARRITGAGDTFMAAHLHAESRGATPEHALAHAQRAAAEYVSTL